jgi:ribonuclease HII
MNKRGKARWIIGVDEVGRGPIAGPVTVCMFAAKHSLDTLQLFPNQIIRDSKKLSKDNRIKIYQTIRKLRKYKSNEIEYVLASKTAKYIDTYGISKAIDACISSCITKLALKSVAMDKAKVYLDGSLKIKGIAVDQQTVIKGDEKIAHIALASIIAKVKRDAYMANLGQAYPNYNWKSNSGYGTNEHYAAIAKEGLSLYHRSTFIV